MLLCPLLYFITGAVVGRFLRAAPASAPLTRRTSMDELYGNDLYQAVMRRRSVRKYTGQPLTDTQRAAVEAAVAAIVPLNDCAHAFELLPVGETTAKFGTDCLAVYGPDEPDGWLNTGYMLEQLDLRLQLAGLGACWYGMARPKREGGALPYHILMTFGNCDPSLFRSGPADFNRRPAEELWPDEFDPAVRTAALLAPSACNSQPWFVKSEGGALTVCRRVAAKSIIPPSKKPFFGNIDCGIFLLVLETALRHAGYRFVRRMLPRTVCGGLESLAEYTVSKE